MTVGQAETSLGSAHARRDVDVAEVGRVDRDPGAVAPAPEGQGRRARGSRSSRRRVVVAATRTSQAWPAQRAE